ncbi:MAG TPA: hypothetical protein VK817_09945 [Trebonia sp.]|jgi:hypothetical protein|nr:hypothetical protein [Trebonia sp.]
MKTGNSVPAANDHQHGARVRDDSQLRDIEELVAKLQLVTKQLSFPPGTEPDASAARVQADLQVETEEQLTSAPPPDRR